MKNLVKIALFGLLACSLAPQSAHATLIQAGWYFDQAAGLGPDTSVASLSQTVTAINGNITFDFNVTITSSTGRTVIDTSAGRGISSLAGGNLDVGEVLTFTTSISSIVQNGPHRINLQDLSFRFLGTESANGTASGGTLATGGAGTASWIDANGPGADFSGHLPGTTVFGGPLGSGAEGFAVNTFPAGGSGSGAGTSMAGTAGFDLPRTAIWNGAPFGTNVISFTHTTDMGSYRLNDIVVQIRATPEPSSLLLGLVAAVIGMFKFGWRRTLQLVGIRKKSDLVTT